MFTLILPNSRAHHRSHHTLHNKGKPSFVRRVFSRGQAFGQRNGLEKNHINANNQGSPATSTQG